MSFVVFSLRTSEMRTLRNEQETGNQNVIFFLQLSAACVRSVTSRLTGLTKSPFEK